MNIDFKSLQADFQGLPKDVGAWPLAPRVAALLGIAVVILAGGWFALWNEQIETLTQRQTEEATLKQDFVAKKTQAVNREVLMRQSGEIARSLDLLLKQLPSKSEVEALLIEVNQSGMGRGLQFELFRPGPENVRDFYAELPVNVRLTGTYHDLGAFAEDIGKLSRIVTLGNITIEGNRQAKDGTLVMDAVIRTFRYLDEGELAAQRRAGQARGGRR